jgi:hypothetical protein
MDRQIGRPSILSSLKSLLGTGESLEHTRERPKGPESYRGGTRHWSATQPY